MLDSCYPRVARLESLSQRGLLQTAGQRPPDAGGTAYFFATYEHLGSGNTHMMMLDKNNLDIADAIIGWIEDNAKP